MKVDSIITLDKGELSRNEWEKLLRRLTFIDADENEVSAFQYVMDQDKVYIPRGAWDMVPSHVDVTDLRSLPAQPERAYTRVLDAKGYAGQSKAVRAMIEHEQGRVIAPPGRGKTEIALAFASLCKTRVLVIVHTQDLFKQWIDRAEKVVPDMPVGVIQGKTCQVEQLTVATAQTLKKHLDDGGKFWRQFGCVIVDEAHHAAAETWEWVLNVCPAYYRFGVTASEKRSDGRQALVRFNIGPVIYKLKFKSQVPMRVVPMTTGFHSKWNGQQYTRIVRELVRDPQRNRIIAKIVAHEIQEGNSVLVLSRQIVHLELMRDEILLALAQSQKGLTKNMSMEIVSGRLPRPKRDKYIEQLRNGSLRCILGTQLFEEGVDIPRINRIVLAFPGTEITALQKIGRGSRKHEGKFECIVYDMLDDLCTPLIKQWVRRRTWYKSVGIKVEKVRKHDKKRKDEVRRTKTKKGRLGQRLYQVARPRR